MPGTCGGKPNYVPGIFVYAEVLLSGVERNVYKDTNGYEPNFDRKKMRQILVTLDESTSMQSIRRAISMLRGVKATSVYKEEKKEASPAAEQQAYVKESLTRAYKEMKAAETSGLPLQSVDDFIRELEEAR